MNHTIQTPSPEIRRLLAEFESRSGLSGVDYEIKQRPDGEILIINLSNPTERFYRVLQEITFPEGSSATSTLQKRAPSNRLQSPEARYFLRILAESLNINRFSFKEDFFARYTNSVSNAEAQIVASANHIVYGRRGAGKSSLLLFAMRSREKANQPSVWVDMQVYEKRRDNRILLDILADILRQLQVILGSSTDYSHTLRILDRSRENAEPNDETIRQMLPELRRLFSSLQDQAHSLFIFLDDFHVVDREIQPKLLGYIYSITRGNNIFLKLSADSGAW